MSTLITILHVLVCLFLMLTVLLQSGKGGGMGGAFGGSNAGTVFGGGGASNFLRKMTAGAGTIFMLTSIVLAFLASHNTADALERYGEQQQSLADDKEKARAKAIESGSKNGSNMPPSAGSAATMSPPGGPDLKVTPEKPDPANGSGASITPVTPGLTVTPGPVTPVAPGLTVAPATPGLTVTPGPVTPGPVTPATPGLTVTPGPVTPATPPAKPATTPATPTTPATTPAKPATPATPAPAPATPAAGSAK